MDDRFQVVLENVKHLEFDGTITREELSSHELAEAPQINGISSDCVFVVSIARHGKITLHSRIDDEKTRSLLMQLCFSVMNSQSVRLCDNHQGGLCPCDDGKNCNPT